MATTTAAQKTGPGQGGVRRVPGGVSEPQAARPDLRQVGHAGPGRAGQRRLAPVRRDCAGEPRPMRYSELSRLLAGVSQKMLTQTLRSLERDGLVTRTATPTVPVTVTYELTDLGLSLHQMVRGLKTWAENAHGRRPRPPRDVRRRPRMTSSAEAALMGVHAGVTAADNGDHVPAGKAAGALQHRGHTQRRGRFHSESSMLPEHPDTGDDGRLVDKNGVVADLCATHCAEAGCPGPLPVRERAHHHRRRAPWPAARSG